MEYSRVWCQLQGLIPILDSFPVPPILCQESTLLLQPGNRTDSEEADVLQQKKRRKLRHKAKRCWDANKLLEIRFALIEYLLLFDSLSSSKRVLLLLAAVSQSTPSATHASSSSSSCSFSPPKAAAALVFRFLFLFQPNEVIFSRSSNWSSLYVSQVEDCLWTLQRSRACPSWEYGSGGLRPP